MKRLFNMLRSASRNESGAVMPVLMMMSSLMVVSGVAFLSVTSYQSQVVGDATAHVQSRYYAETALRMALFRIENSPPDQWATWANLSDSSYTASFDAAAQTVTGVGWYKGVMDTLKASVAVDTTFTQEQLGHIILYKKSLSVDNTVTLTHPAANGPKQIKGWWRKWRTKHKLFDHHLYPDLKKHFLREVTEKGKKRKKDLLYKYTGNQVFDGALGDGIHYVKGSVELRNGTTLTGSLYATGTISFSGAVTINAMQLPEESPLYPGYLPAVVALRSSDAEQELEEDGTEVKTEASTYALNVNINGLIFARRTINFGSGVHVTGMMMARRVYLTGTATVVFDGRYALPPPPEMEIDPEYKPYVTAWVEKGF